MATNDNTNTNMNNRYKSLKTIKGQEGFQQWRFKAEAYFSMKKIGWVLTCEQPTTPMQRPMTEAEQLTYDASLPQGQPRETTVMETEKEFQERQKSWAAANLQVWEELVECAEDDALTTVTSVHRGDGRAAWSELINKYDAHSPTTLMGLLVSLIQMKQGTTPTLKFVTTWRETIRKLQTRSVVFHPALESVLFLSALGEHMKHYKRHCHLNGLLGVPMVYTNAIDFARTKLDESDEADNKGLALHTGERKRGRGNGDNWKERCRYGAKCKHIKHGRCRFYHPPAEIIAAKEEKRQDRSRSDTNEKRPGDWTCANKKCRKSNFAFRSRCFTCNTKKPNTDFVKRKQHRAHMARENAASDDDEDDIDAEVKRLEALVQDQERQMQEAQQRCDEANIDVDLGFQCANVLVYNVESSDDEDLSGWWEAESKELLQWDVNEVGAWGIVKEGPPNWPISDEMRRREYEEARILNGQFGPRTENKQTIERLQQEEDAYKALEDIHDEYGETGRLAGEDSDMPRVQDAEVVHTHSADIAVVVRQREILQDTESVNEPGETPPRDEVEREAASIKRRRLEAVRDMREQWRAETAMNAEMRATKRAKFLIDSGASSHFVNNKVRITRKEDSTSVVRTADGSEIDVMSKGLYTGTYNFQDNNDTDDTHHNFRMHVEQDYRFKKNLFSVKQAVNDGCKVVFQRGESYMQMQDGTKIPFENTSFGWEMQLE